MSIGREGQPLEEECVKERGKLAMPKGLIAEMEVKRRDMLATKRRTENGGGDFSDGG